MDNNRSKHQIVITHNLKSLRKLRGYSQSDLGRAVGKDRNFIANVERRGNVPKGYLNKIADALGISNPNSLLKDRLDIRLGADRIDFS